MRNTEEYRGYQYEDEEDEEDEEYKEDEEDEEYKEDEEDEDEEYKEEREGESPHILAFRQEAKIVDHWMYERLEDDLDLADGKWISRDTRALCIMLREAVDNTMGKEQSEARAEVAEAVTKMMFQPLVRKAPQRENISIQPMPTKSGIPKNRNCSNTSLRIRKHSKHFWQTGRWTNGIPL